MSKPTFTTEDTPASIADVAEAKSIIAKAMSDASLNLWYEMLKGPKGDAILEYARGDSLENLMKEGNGDRIWAVLRACAPDRYRALAFSCVADTGGIGKGTAGVRLITLDRNALRNTHFLLLLQHFLALRGVIKEFQNFDIEGLSICFNSWCHGRYEHCDEAAREMGLPTMEDFIGTENCSRYLEILHAEGERSQKAVESFPKDGRLDKLPHSPYGLYGPHEGIDSDSAGDAMIEDWRAG